MFHHAPLQATVKCGGGPTSSPSCVQSSDRRQPRPQMSGSLGRNEVEVQ